MTIRVPGTLAATLIISPEPWNAHAVSKHHYAITLAARGSRVWFLDPPDERIEGIRIDPVPGHPGVHVVAAPRVARGLRFLPGLLRRRLEARWLARLEREAGEKFDSVWLFENSRFYDLRFAGDRLKIYHQVDLNQSFHPQTAAATADICFCTTDFIRARLAGHNPRVYKIHHGLAPGFLDEPAGASGASVPALSLEQRAHFDGRGPHAVYIGNLDMAYLDADLLAETARRFPGIPFHFVGGYREDGRLRRLAADLPNVIWWGKVDAGLIPAILERADVLLVTYQARHWRDQASPHKFMEYLGSGKAIVATYTDEYKDKRDLLEMVDNPADFAAAFERVVSKLAHYNSPPLLAARSAFARAHTYDRQLDSIFELLRQHRLVADSRQAQ